MTATNQAFRFFDNREKYLLFVTTCSEKQVVAHHIGRQFDKIQPGPNALRLFDAGMGDGTVLCHLMRDLHQRFTHVPWVVVGKEISMEDVRLTLEKLPDRFSEHPELVMVVTNMYYSQAPWLWPRQRQDATVNWNTVALEGSTAHDFAGQISALDNLLTDGWQVRNSEKTGNPLYVQPSVLVLYRKDREFVLKPLLPKAGGDYGQYDFIVASQPYRARIDASAKVRNVVGPLAQALAPGGRMMVVQSYGRDPGMDIIRKVWPDDNPFKTSRHDVVEEARRQLADSAELSIDALSDTESIFRYRLHTLPSEVGSTIGTSTVMAAWNAAVYVAQVNDERLQHAMQSTDYLAHTSDVVRQYGGLWFNDESFVVRKKQD